MESMKVLGLLPRTQVFGRFAVSRNDSLAVLRILGASHLARAEPTDLLEAWAQESGSSQRIRLMRLVRSLRQGGSLADTLGCSTGVIREDHMMAVRYGIISGLLPETITTVLEAETNEPTAVPASTRVLIGYLSLILLVFLGVNGLLGARILPMFRGIFEQYGSVLPPVSEAALLVSPWVVAVTGWGLLIVTVALILSRIPAIHRRLRGVFAESADRALILDLLGTAMEAGRPLQAAAGQLASCQRNRRLARDLEQVSLATAADGSLLAAMRLVPAAPAAVIDVSPDGVTGGGLLRRRARDLRDSFRTRRLISIEAGFPAVVILMGLLTALLALAVFTPLTQLVHSLT
jgi:type IV pilus assembly protein PilC